jgi:hypothetical protein
MDKQQALERLTSLENEAKELRKILEDSVKVSKEERFEQLISGWEYKVDLRKYPNTIFFFKGGKCLGEYDFKCGFVWIAFENIWSVFYNEYAMNWDEIQLFITNQVEEHLNLKGVTPGNWDRLKNSTVEEHFNLKGVTLFEDSGVLVERVEEHFNLKGVTPCAP